MRWRNVKFSFYEHLSTLNEIGRFYEIVSHNFITQVCKTLKLQLDLKPWGGFIGVAWVHCVVVGGPVGCPYSVLISIFLELYFAS